MLPSSIIGYGATPIAFGRPLVYGSYELSPITALLLFPFQPRRVALAFKDASMWRVYAIHWLGMVPIGGVLILMDFILNGQWSSVRASVVLTILNDAQSLFITIFVIICGEGWFLVTAFIMVCWAGRSERLMETFRYAVRVGWLYTGHLIWVVAVWCAIIDFLSSQRPFVDVFVVASLWLGAAVIIWSIITYLRALTASREPIHSSGGLRCVKCSYDLRDLPGDSICPECTTPISETPVDLEDPQNQPICEWCGYLLIQINPNGLCPECGRSIADSTVQCDRRPLTEIAWKPRRVLPAWIDSERFFRRMTTGDVSRGACVRIASTIIFSGLGAATGFILAVRLIDSSPPGIKVSAMVFVVFGGFVSWGLLMVVSAIASFLGVIATRRSSRNRMSAALNVVAMLSTPLIIWCSFAMFVFPILVYSRVSSLMLLVWLLGNLVVAVLFGRACAKRLPYVQFANR